MSRKTTTPHILAVGPVYNPADQVDDDEVVFGEPCTLADWEPEPDQTDREVQDWVYANYPTFFDDIIDDVGDVGDFSHPLPTREDKIRDDDECEAAVRREQLRNDGHY